MNDKISDFTEDSTQKHYETLNDLIERGNTPNPNATYMLLYEHKHFLTFLPDEDTIKGKKQAWISKDNIEKYCLYADTDDLLKYGGAFVNYDEYLKKIIEFYKQTNSISTGGEIRKEPGYRLLYHITPKGTEIINVYIQYTADGRWAGYNFTVKETGFNSHTNYPWMIAENSEENKEKIKVYESLEKDLKKFEKVVEKHRKQIITLKK